MTWSGDEKYWSEEAFKVLKDIENRPRDMSDALIVALALAKTYQQGMLSRLPEDFRGVWGVTYVTEDDINKQKDWETVKRLCEAKGKQIALSLQDGIKRDGWWKKDG